MLLDLHLANNLDELKKEYEKGVDEKKLQQQSVDK